MITDPSDRMSSFCRGPELADILNCEKRESTGTLRMRRLRQSGLVPAVLYGKGENKSLQIPSKDVNAAVHHGSQIVKLRGCCSESALIKEVQWDAFGIEILHLDLGRIGASEAVELTLPLELVGEAPGTKSGGMVKHLHHSLTVRIPADAVPEKLEVRINDLELHGSIKAEEISLPEGATLIDPPDEVVVQCVDAVGQETAEDEDGGDAAEPEVIGRKSDDEAEGDGE